MTQWNNEYCNHPNNFGPMTLTPMCSPSSTGGSSMTGALSTRISSGLGTATSSTTGAASAGSAAGFVTGVAGTSGVCKECSQKHDSQEHPIGLGPMVEPPRQVLAQMWCRGLSGGYRATTVVRPVPYRVQLWPDPAKTSSAINWV